MYYIGNNRDAAMNCIQNGIDTCRQGLESCCTGVEELSANNTCRGSRALRDGIARCEQGLCQICCGIRAAGLENNREIMRGVRECREGLTDCLCGLKECCRGDIGDGALSGREGIALLEQGLNRIENVQQSPIQPNGCTAAAPLENGYNLNPPFGDG